MTPQVILRLEQGLFSNIPVNVLAAITHSQAQETAALSNYQDWVTQERASHFVPTSLIFEQRAGNALTGIPCLTYRNLKNFYKSTTAVARFFSYSDQYGAGVRKVGRSPERRGFPYSITRDWI